MQTKTTNSNVLRHAKHRFRDIAQRMLPSKIPPIVVASMGRSGSTLVHDAICRGLAVARFGSSGKLMTNLVRGYSWDMESKSLHHGVAYKTHGLASELPSRPEVKVVFLFGSAVDAAVSVLNARKTYGDEWIQAHFQHLRAQGGIEHIAERDVLRFSEQLEGWAFLTSNSAIALKYDALWDNQDQLSGFLGFPVTLPPRRARSVKQVDANIIAQMCQTYEPLETRIAAMPDVIYSGPGVPARTDVANQ